MFFNQYPYLNLNDLNLDYILKTLKSLSEQLENFISLNTIKYANPIQWNITKQYEANTVVIDANDGTAYLSVKPVPTGVAITNTDYWTPIFTLNLLSANQNITLRDDGANTLATFTSAVDDWLIWNGVLYKVTRPIALNEAYVAGYNITRYTVELFIKDYIDALNDVIGNLDDLDTTVKDSIVNAINEVNRKVGAVSCIIPFDNVAALIAADLKVGDVVKCLGYYNANDGGDGLFKISDTADGFHHTLNNGLYANNINDDFKLPRYGGYYVNEMVDNVRPYMQAHQWKHIVLPPANAKHPGAKFYVENDNNVYFWVVNHPIVYSEEMAYSVNDFYDRVVLDIDATDTEAVFKISDADKPEDIYFNGALMVEGYHFNNLTNYPDHALLVEGTARLNIQNLHAAYAKNCLTLGGDNALNPINMAINFLECGSCTQHGIYAKNTMSTSLIVGSVRFENPLRGCTHIIYGEGAMFDWYIGDILQALVNDAIMRPLEFKLSGITSRELAIEISSMRCVGSANDGDIVLDGTAGTVHIAYALLQNSNTNVKIVNKSTAGIVTLDKLETRGMPYTLDTASGTSALIEIENAPATGVRTENGTNIKVNGVVDGTTTAYNDAFILRNDQTPPIVQLKNKGVTITI